MNEDRLKNLRLVEPSGQLKERVRSAALSAWHETPKDVAWWIPVRRLGIAAVLALAMIRLADYTSAPAAIGWQMAGEVRSSAPQLDFDEPGYATYTVLARHALIVPRPIDAAAIRKYQEQVRQVLDEQG